LNGEKQNFQDLQSVIEFTKNDKTPLFRGYRRSIKKTFCILFITSNPIVSRKCKWDKIGLFLLFYTHFLLPLPAKRRKDEDIRHWHELCGTQ
jgi:hypothetical protein